MKEFPPAQVRRTLAKYSTRETVLQVAEGIALSIAEVQDPYLLFERAVEREQRGGGTAPASERLPYWAEVWPAAVGLAQWFAAARPEPAGSAVRELGCGLGVAGIALARLGWRVLATDYVEDALVFAQANARRNGVGTRHGVAYLDWSRPAGVPLACAVASDVVYERKSHPALVRCLQHLLLPGGRFYLSDPQRPVARQFAALLRGRGYLHRQVSCPVVWRDSAATVDIHRFERPA